MNKFLAAVLVLSLILTTSGCGGITTHTAAYSWKNNSSYELGKLNYDAKRRVWLYEKEALLLRGKKITQKETAEEMLKVYSLLPESLSTTHSVSIATQTVIMGPFFIIMSGGVVLASPFIATADTAARHDSFDRYINGEKLLAEGKNAAARQKFHEALNFHPVLAYGSDLLYKLAETYDAEGNSLMANVFYREFLECSLDLYPKDFEEFDKKYVNNLDQLNMEFSKADEKTGVKTSTTVTKTL